MLGSGNGDVIAQDRLEHFELLRAETRTGGGRGTDRAMVLDEKKRTIVLRLHISHIPFVAANCRERLEALPHRLRVGDPPTIRGNLVACTQREEPLESRLPERLPDPSDETQ